jgi:uncharacterized membrane protein
MKNKSSNMKNLFVVWFLAAAGHLFAADSSIMPAGMTSLMDDILGIFTGAFVKTILVICLCGCAVAYGYNKDNEQMKKKVIAIGIAAAILCTASFIVDAVWTAAT